MITNEVILSIFKNDDEIKFRKFLNRRSNWHAELLNNYFDIETQHYMRTQLIGAIFKAKAYKCFGELAKIVDVEMLSRAIRHSEFHLNDSPFMITSMMDYIMSSDGAENINILDEKKKWVEIAKPLWVHILLESAWRKWERTPGNDIYSSVNMVNGIIGEISARSDQNSYILVILHDIGMLSRQEAEKIFQWSINNDKAKGFKNVSLAEDSMLRIEAIELKRGHIKSDDEKLALKMVAL
jgi:hypothetical protein